MIVGTILLTEDNFYVTHDDKLPLRPKHDKTLLKALCKGQRVSAAGYLMLPPSIRTIVELDNRVPNMPITICEIAKADLLIVSRSNESITQGKQFRFDNFEVILKDRKIELWRRK